MQKAIGSREQGPEAPISTSLRALAAVASRLGVDASVEQLRRRFALQPGEPDTPTLIALARELGLEAQALHIKFSSSVQSLVLEERKLKILARRAKNIRTPSR